MKNLLALPLVVVSGFALTGCFDDDDDPQKSNVRVIHASSDAPAVNVNVNGQTVVSGADYKQAAVLTPNAGQASLSIDGLLPGGETATVIDTDAALRFDTSYDVIAVGKVGDETIEPLVLTDDGQRDSADSVRLRVAHLSPDAQEAAGGPVDVYVTAAGAELPEEATFSFSFKESVGPLEVPAGEYQVRVTPAGTDTIVYDSGTVPLPAGADLLVAAVDNTVFGESPISLLAINGADVSEIVDASAGSGIRAVHNSSDAGLVDLYVNATPGSDPATVEDIAFTDTVPEAAVTGAYVALEAGENQVAVTGADGTVPVIDATLDLAVGSATTIVAAGTVAQGSVQALVFEDDSRSVVTAAKLRVIHGAEEADTVDVYLLPTAEGGAAATEINSAEPALDDFEFGQSSGYVEVPEGDYVVFITSTDGSEFLKTGSITLTAGSVYTAIARAAPEDDNNVAGLTLLDDFLTP
ncbi:DUF4397 domain-containing protein [Marinobacter salinisoli]|uniref:DUF4397 domain-containing protein n=1 Tax=Marinobacter salinisoli TaxID=2769486 RepID=A0ABX7MY45_9GAMM|nr:DUF4397 domain-containing protein [Marinobacter salinisoli]QSP96350.1 DUF4397 domain-containing protein [Marinobacter salinisoli]